MCDFDSASENGFDAGTDLDISEGLDIDSDSDIDMGSAFEDLDDIGDVEEYSEAEESLEPEEVGIASLDEEVFEVGEETEEINADVLELDQLEDIESELMLSTELLEELEVENSDDPDYVNQINDLIESGRLIVEETIEDIDGKVLTREGITGVLESYENEVEETPAEEMSFSNLSDIDANIIPETEENITDVVDEELFITEDDNIEEFLESVETLEEEGEFGDEEIELEDENEFGDEEIEMEDESEFEDEEIDLEDKSEFEDEEIDFEHEIESEDTYLETDTLDEELEMSVPEGDILEMEEYAEDEVQEIAENIEERENDEIQEIQELNVNYDEIYEGLDEESLERGFEGIDIYADTERLDSSLENFEQSNWEELSLEGQKESMVNLADYVEEIIGFDDPPIIEYYNNPREGDYGGYNASTNTLRVNEYMLYNSSEAADTVAHELWHAHQHECAENPQSERHYQYQYNFANYITPELGHEAYENQLLEAEARAFAAQFKGRLSNIAGRTQV